MIPTIEMEIKGQLIKAEVLTANFNANTMKIRYYILQKDKKMKPVIENASIDKFLNQYIIARIEHA